MADTITVTVRASGGDYTSLSAAESGEQRDLVAADEIALFDVGDVEDATRCTIAGWTTDATRYVIIRGATPTSATWDTSRYRMVLGSGESLITISQDYTRIENIQTRSTDHSWNTPGGIGIGVPNARITGCWIENACATSGQGLDQGRGIDGGTQSSGFRVYVNNIIVGRWARGIHVRGSNADATAVVYHNTVVGLQSGTAFVVTRDSGSFPIRLYNNIAQVTGTAACFTTDAASGGNLSSDATSPQTALRNITLDFAGAGDYALDPVEDTEAIGAGVDLSGDATYPVTTDILGTTRPATPSIGAWERAGGGAYEINAEPGSYAVTGSAATLLHHRLLSADPGSYAVTGAEAILARGRFLVADPGAYAVTGAEATLIYTPAGAYELTCEAGTYAITGADAMLLVGRALSADPGAYSVTGTDAALLAGRVLHAEPGSYTLTGSEAALLVGRVLAALAGDYALTGADATLTYTPATGAYELVCAPGSYAVTGADVSLVMGRVLAAAPGVYTVTGSDAATLVGRVLEAAPGSYLVTGAEAAFLYHRALAADPGAYAVSGLDAGLTWSGETPEPTPDTRVWVIRDATRTWVIRDATRTWVIRDATRTWIA